MSNLTILDFLDDYSRLVFDDNKAYVPTLIEESYDHIKDDCQYLVDAHYGVRSRIKIQGNLKDALAMLADLRTLPEYGDIIPDFRKYCSDNYDAGFDVFVEAFDDLDLRLYFRGNLVDTVESAIASATEFVTIREGS
ncbi:conserved hypothetical protein [Vibrio phage 150E35-1]|nr:conserved hypothetical protein [Vibrio phage 150E35-1]